MSVKEDKRNGVFIKVDGTYFKKGSEPGSYELELKISDDPEVKLHFKDNEPTFERDIQAYAFKKLVPEYLNSHSKDFPGYDGVRECFLREFTRVGSKNKETETKEKTIDNMNMQELCELATLKGLEVQPRKMSTIGKARSAVADELDNRELAAQDLEISLEAPNKRTTKDPFEKLEGILR